MNNLITKRKVDETQKGFTIIEVVLVLAIAGLIFLMVFIALPALQRNQRDTQRKNDMARVQTAIANYTTANRGSLPADSTAWNSFVTNYLAVNGDSFIDPSGTKSTSTTYVFTASDEASLSTKFADSQNRIYYTAGYVCANASSDVVKSGSRKVAFRMALEGGGYICVNN